MIIPISTETVVLFGSTCDARLKETADKLEAQGRMVEIHPVPEQRGELCYCSNVNSWPHSHKPNRLC